MSTNELVEFRDSVRALLGKHATSAALRGAMGTELGYDAKLWRMLCEQVGVAALAVPEEFGGAGASLVESLMVVGELGRTLAGVPMPELSRTYVEAAPGDLDLRPKRKEGPALIAEPYFQVFSERMPFVPNLSFADLLFAEGPASVSVLGRCRQG